MLRFIGTVLKLGLFAAAVLILGNYLKWNGHTLSDEVRTQVSHAERWGRNKAPALLEPRDSKASARKKPARFAPRALEQNPPEQIPASERQKLKELIRELNSAR